MNFFYGHVTQKCPASNLTFMKMIRCITNNALTYLLPFVTSKYNAITLRSEKGRVVETYSYSLENFELKDNTLIWRLISMKHKKLVKVGCKRKLFSERKNSSWKI